MDDYSHIDKPTLLLRLLPGGFSAAGFIGHDEDPAQIIAGDNNQLAQFNLSPGDLARRLAILLERACLRHWARLTRRTLETLEEEAWDPIATREVLGDVSADMGREILTGLRRTIITPRPTPSPKSLAMDVRGAMFVETIGPHQIAIGGSRGTQACPWGCHSTNTNDRSLEEELALYEEYERNPMRGGEDIVSRLRPESLAWLNFGIRNTSTGEEVEGGGLVVHLILKHQFFEGPGSPYRVDPLRLARVLQLV